MISAIWRITNYVTKRERERERERVSQRESRENSPDLISAIGEEQIMSLREQNRVRESEQMIKRERAERNLEKWKRVKNGLA